ncbi:MAG: hypothetical protein AAGC68_09320 [Verrucomicrobiota bacterium]
MMKTRHFLLFLLLSGAFVLSSALHRSAFSQEDDWLEFYYIEPTPERFVEEMKAWASDGTLDNEFARPALISFLSRIIRENRDQIRNWYTELAGLTPEQKQVLHTAMLFARVSEADEIMTETFGKQYHEQRVETQKILEMPLDKASTMDMLWGFFYATGSETPIRRIILSFRFEEAPDDPDGVEVPKGYLPLYKDLPNFAFDSLVANAERHPRLIDILEKLLREDTSLLQEEKRAVYDVLSEMKPGTYPPIDWQKVDEERRMLEELEEIEKESI